MCPEQAGKKVVTCHDWNTISIQYVISVKDGVKHMTSGLLVLVPDCQFSFIPLWFLEREAPFQLLTFISFLFSNLCSKITSLCHQ